jgi:hypothetical protein
VEVQEGLLVIAITEEVEVEAPLVEVVVASIRGLEEVLEVA